ncbi:YobI family P-loop NTPase [Pedobacter sp. WC2501]|uniref:YobI family P-loop NTPase n=1 Tax=Pedobacter sp. WC2501 TaxID=3461400 RepID=UPI004045F722
MLLFLLFLAGCLVTILLTGTYLRIILEIIDQLFEVLKEWMRFVLLKLITFSQNLLRKLNRSIGPSKRLGYEPLSPEADEEGDPSYSAAIDYALCHPDIRNVAVTGPYGSGKSTILKTYQLQHPEYRYLNVSLASFKDEKVKDDLLEVSILQQMFYHVEHKRIPDSRFKRIKKLSPSNIFIKVLLMFFWTLCLVSLLDKKPFKFPLSWHESITGREDLFFNVVFFFFVLLTFGILYSIFRLYNNSRFNKLNLSTGEVELGSQVDTSILNKNLDEIIYFFDATDFDVVIFEDLDRFKETEIFTKLRELNILINNAQQIDRKIVFLYAIREEIFTKSEHKTKFFDFIIPVIPLVNSSNSASKLLDRLHTMDLVPNISDKLVIDLSYYIADMRLVKNVFNEYVLYRSRLSELNLDQEKLLAIVILKNAEPLEFAGLNKNEGDIHQFFSRKAELIEVINGDYQAKVDELSATLAGITDDVLNDTRELRELYVFRLMIKFGVFERAITISSTRYDLQDLLKEEIFEAFRNAGELLHHDGSGWRKVKFETMDEKVLSENSFGAREEKILFRSNYMREEARLELERIRGEMQRARSMSFGEIIVHPAVQALTEAIFEKDLIVYLIRHGFLDEDYQDFITHFHAGKISRRDKDFILSLNNRRPLEFEYKLDKVGNLFSELRLRDFEQIEIMNFTLLDFMLSDNKKANTAELDAFMMHLSSGSSSAVRFREEYMRRNINHKNFVALLASHYPGLWNEILRNHEYSEDQKKQYFSLLINNAQLTSIKSQDADGSLADYIVGLHDFLRLVDRNKGFDHIKSVLKVLNIKFKDLMVDEDLDAELFALIIQNEHYKLNDVMIAKVILYTDKRKYIADRMDEKLDTMHYGAILLSGLKPLLKYIDSNFSTYINDVYLKIGRNTRDTEEALLKIYNMPQEILDLESKIKVVEKTHTRIAGISELIEGLWGPLLVNNKVSANWDSVMGYHAVYGFDEKLITFLNFSENAVSLGRSGLSSSKITAVEAEMDSFARALLGLSELSLDAYGSLASGINYNYIDLDFSSLPEDKVFLLIDSGKLLFNVETYELLKEQFDDLHIKLAEQWPVEFNEVSADLDFSVLDYEKLMSSPMFGREQRVQLIINMDDEKPAQSTSLAEQVAMELAVEKLEIDNSFLIALSRTGITPEAKVRYLLNYLDEFTAPSVGHLLENIGGEFLKIVSETETEAVFANTEINENFLSALMSKGIINKFKRSARWLKVELNG